MKYFSLSNSTDEKEVGKIWPQCDSVPDGYSYNELIEGSNSMVELTNDEFPKENPKLIFGLHKKAKLTDVVSPSNISARGLLVNEKVKNILENFNLIEHKYYPAIIKDRGHNLEYYWLHLVKPDLSGVNFQESNFEITNLVNKPLANIKINNWEHFMERKMNLPMKHIKAKKLVLETETKKDLMYFPYIYSYMFVSEELVIELAIQKITGIEITEQSILV